MAVVKRDWINEYAFHEAIGDIGCAMSYAAIPGFDTHILRQVWNELYQGLLGLGKTILGSGNHFIDGCMDSAGRFVVLVHVGSRMILDQRRTFRFDKDYQRYLERVNENHEEIWNRCARSLD